MRKFFFGILIVLNVVKGQGQEVQIKGTILDTLEHKPLQNALVLLLSKSDSFLIESARSNASGAFSLMHIRSGNYILSISYPKFASYADYIKVTNEKGIDLGKIPLSLKSTLLKEVIIKSGSAIRIKKDSIEYLADSFSVREGATVEELLKVMPGLQVNSKGQITAQGKRVDRVLVDGEEFFGDDPTIATQNLPAKAVDKVQVYDTKDDRQAITGIRTGREGKTLNIKLKADQKKGSFGKIEGGTNFNDIIDSKLIFNKFVNSKKVSFFFAKSNTNVAGINSQDQKKLGFESDEDFDEINRSYFVFTVGNSTFPDSWKGFPGLYSAGGLYANKFNDEKQSLNLSYQYNRLGIFNKGSVTTQIILPERSIFRNSQGQTNSIYQKHTLGVKYEWKINSLASIKFASSSNLNSVINDNSNSSKTVDENNLRIGENSTKNHNDIDRSILDDQLSYKQSFSKKGRILLVTSRVSQLKDNQLQRLLSTTQNYKDGNYLFSDTIDQQRTVKGGSLSIGNKFTFSEPLSLKWNLIIGYGYNINNSRILQNTFNQSPNGEYQDIDSLYSNDFHLKSKINTSDLILKYTGQKLNISGGTSVSINQMVLSNETNKQINNYTFRNLLPQFQISYSPILQRIFSFSYTGSPIRPNISELQPVRLNSNPLNIFIGNPNLKVGFNHNLQFIFNSFQVRSGKSFYISTSLNIKKDAISTNNSIDQFGKNYFTSVNLNGNNSWFLTSGWNSGRSPKKLSYSVSISGNGGKSSVIVNNRKVVTNYSMSRLKQGLRYNPKNIDLRTSFNVGYALSATVSSEKTSRDYLLYGSSIECTMALPLHIELTSTTDFDFQSRTAFFTSGSNIILWNAAIAKRIFKDRSGRIAFTANDILNQNKGINRIINSNFIMNEVYLKRSRYFFVKFEWAFNNMNSDKK